MLLFPKALSSETIPMEVLRPDRKAAKTFEEGALGKKALYISNINFYRTTYIPLRRVERVYKRLAVSKGYYTGGVFGTLAYLVVRYDKGKEKAFRFKREEAVNALLDEIRKSTSIPVGKQ